jgi:predicted nucleic acid-binding Zn ribbon protein
MAHKRKDTLSAPKEWAKHLRPFGKKIQSKSERRAAKKDIDTRLEP